MNLHDILRIRGFDVTARTKMMRHQDSRYDVEMLFRREFLESYQSVQGGKYLECDYLIAFIGKNSTKAVFAGIWKVHRRLDMPDLSYVEDFPYPDFFKEPSDYHYSLEQVPGYDDLIGRMVLDWGTTTRAWHQWLRDMPVTEILPQGQVKSFPGYLDFVLSFDEMSQIVSNPEANRVWHQMLSGVAGVYLITDTRTGQLYVGSAYGKDGILGRWKIYAKTGHGGNAKLKSLLSVNPSRKENFSFTILRTLPTTLTQREVIAKEQLYKLKLGSRAHGLNLN
ncbi:MAG: GIY-YIG nuclease family protein [Alphaproteobacteria bacterium]